MLTINLLQLFKIFVKLKPSQEVKPIIDWFIQTGRTNMLAKETRQNKNSNGDDDQTM